MSDNIKVAIKVRPLIKRETDDRLPIQWRVYNNTIANFDPETEKPNGEQFAFDFIFDMNQRNVDVFDNIVKPIVEGAMKGFNGTIFAYGQTGSGKTYTMMGSEDEPGVIPLAVDYIFDYIQNDPSREFLLRVSYIEIYNEKINDLLDKSKTDLKMKEDLQGNITVDCKEEVISKPSGVIDIMKRGDKHRRIGETNMNERSSRSHTIFRIIIESCEKDDPERSAYEAQLNLIDLAGSEKARQTGATGERFNEGRHINLSLSTLALVIKQLSEAKGGNGFVNFRDSKLTRILQPSLAGNAMTTIICAVTPAAIEETQQTLAFAARAKGVKTKPKVNENISDKALLKRVRDQVRKLESALEMANNKLLETERSNLEERINFLRNNILSKQKDGSKQINRRRRTWAGPFAENMSYNKTLPTIDEVDSFQGSTFKNNLPVNSKPNNIPEIDLMNQSFQTAFADFELQLIQDERAKNRLSSVSDDGHKILPTVTCRDYFVDDDDVNKDNLSPEGSPKRIIDDSFLSAETPKSQLRLQHNELLKKYRQLKEFINYEKQCYEDEGVGEDFHKYRKDVESLTKSLDDSKIIIMDLNKKYSDLQTDYVVLSSKYEESSSQCESLKKEVDNLSLLRERVQYLETENNDYKTKMDKALKELDSLKEDSSSREFEMEALKTKYKKSEKELKQSLEMAWEEHMDPKEKKNMADIAHLQFVINEFKEKEKLLESSSSSETRAKEMEEALKRSEEDNSTLKAQMDELSLRLESLSQSEEAFKRSEEESFVLKAEIENLTKNLEQLSQLSEDLKRSEEEKSILKRQLEEFSVCSKSLSQTNEALKASEEENSALKVEIENLSKRNQQLFESNEALKGSQVENLNMKLQLEELTARLESLSQLSEDLKHSEIENSVLKDQREQLTKSLEMSTEENAELKNKIEELSIYLESASHSDDVLKRSEEENFALKQQLNEFTEHLKKLLYCDGEVSTEIPLVIQIENQIQVLNRRVLELEENLSAKQLEVNKNAEINEKFVETSGRLQNYEAQINAMKIDMDRLEACINEKTSEIVVMEEKINELIAINETIEEKSKKELADYRSEMERMEKELKTALSAVELKDKEINLLQDVSKETVDKEFELKKIIQHLEDDFKNKEEDIIKLKELHLSNLKELELENKELHDKINEFQAIIDDNKEQLVNYQSEKTLNEGEKLSLQALINEKDEELKKMSKLNIELEFLTSEKFQLERNLSELRTQLNEKILELDSCQITKNDMTNLQSYNKELQSFVKDLQDENDVLKKDLENIKQCPQILVDEKEFIDKEKTSMNEVESPVSSIVSSGYRSDITLNDIKSISDEIKLKITEPVSHENSPKTSNTLDVNSSSIFTNGNCTDYEDFSDTLNDITTCTNITVLDNTISVSEISDDELLIILNKKNPSELIEIIQEFNKKYKMFLSELKLKGSESEDIKNDICEMKKVIEELRQTVEVLNADNTDLSGKLSMEKERNREIQFNTVELSKLKDRVMILEEEVTSKEKKIKNLEEELQKNLSALNDLNKQMKELQKENIELSENLMAKLEEVDSVQEQPIEELKNINNKSSELKLTPCDQCAHLVELNQTRKAMKVEGKSVNRRLQDLRKKFDQECAETEILKCKVREEISFHNSTFNESITDVGEVSYAEGKLFQLHEALERFENGHEKLSELYNEKCYEKDKLKDNSFNEHLNLSTSSPLNKSQRESRIKRIQNELETNRNDLQTLKKCINGVSDAVEKLRNRRQFSLETGVNTEENWNSKSEELENLSSKVNDLTKCLQREEEMKSLLQAELENIKSSPTPDSDEISLLNDKIEDYKKNTEQLEYCIKDLKEKLNKCQKENEELCNKLKQVDNKMEDCGESLTDKCDNKELEELEVGRERIMKEIISLKIIHIENLNSKTISELFNVFLNAIITKEEELLQTLIDRHERELKISLNKLEEEKKQLIDDEKRINIWVKDLEREIEKMQNDLSNEEAKNNKLKSEIDELTNQLMDSNYQKQQLKEKIELIETDFQSLQIDFDKQSKNSSLNESTEEQKKLIQQEKDKYELQYSERILKMEEMFKEEIKGLTAALDSYKTQNIDLKNNLEGLEINEEQLKSLIELKTQELNKANNTIEQLSQSLNQLSEENGRLVDDNNNQKLKIEEITRFLKEKCDKLSEYKTKLETIAPEYEILKEQASNRLIKLEEYKSVIENLRDENAKQLSGIKDELDNEKITSSVLNKQLAELNNKNILIKSELDNLKDAYEVLKSENERLLRKIRNSTDKLEAEREKEEFLEKYQMLEKSLDGASNRINELMKMKNQLFTENTELKSKYDMISKENNDNVFKFNDIKFKLNEKTRLYDELIVDKNRVSLECENKKLIIMNLEKELEKMNKINKDLDDENEDMSNKIKEMDDEITKLELKLYEYENSNKDVNNFMLNKDKFNELKILNERLVKELNDCKEICNNLKDENEKLTACSNNQLNKQRKSPSDQKKKRRSDTFDKNRGIDLNNDSSKCQNNDCIKRLEDLDKQLAIETARAQTLEFQIEGNKLQMNNRFSQYDEALRQYQQRNLELKQQLNAVNQKVTNKKVELEDKSTQVRFEKPKSIYLSGESTSGLIKEEAMVQEKLNKLESDKEKYKLLSSKYRMKVKELEESLRQREEEMGFRSSNLNSKNPLLPSMKENLPSKILNNRKLNI